MTIKYALAKTSHVYSHLEHDYDIIVYFCSFRVEI